MPSRTAFDERRERYASATEIQKYGGIAPVTDRSAYNCWVHWRLWERYTKSCFV